MLKPFARNLLVLLFGLAGASSSIAGEHSCQFNQGPAIDGNMFEPPRWPSTLTPHSYKIPGIVRPGYDHFFLLIAYRALSGQPLDAQAQARMAPFDPCWVTDANPLGEMQAQWDQARSWAGKAALTRSSSYGYEQNCQADAYRNAARVLGERVASHGRTAPVRDWIAAQDAVFANCGGSGPVPPDAADNAPAWLHHDRAYQQAAAALYGERHKDAERRFDAIAADSGSPWRTLAPYLAARAQLRQVMKVHGDSADYSDVETRLQALADAADDSTLRRDARRLLRYVQLRTRPAEMLVQLDASVRADPAPDSIGQDVTDFYHAYHFAPKPHANQPFANWLSAMRGAGLPAPTAGWRPAGHLAWLVADLTLATPDTPDLKRTLAEARTIKPSTPAYLSARYHLARLASSGAEAIEIVEAALALPDSVLSAQDANAFRRIGLAHAITPAQLARFAARTNAMSESKVNGRPNVDLDGEEVFNRGLPLDLMLTVARNPATPAPLRRELETVGWTRALLLERYDLATGLAPAIKQAFPGSAPTIDAILNESDPRMRSALAAMLMARYPGMVAEVNAYNILQEDPGTIALPNMRRYTSRDGSRENWWCTIGAGSGTEYVEEADEEQGQKKKPVPPPGHPLLSPEQRAAFKREHRILSGLQNGRDHLSALVMDYARLHPRDERLAPVLHLLIRGANGCSGAEHSKAMFRHLHRYFPNSEWAKRTRSHS